MDYELQDKIDFEESRKEFNKFFVDNNVRIRVRVP
jgi:hypothetical protein